MSVHADCPRLLTSEDTVNKDVLIVLQYTDYVESHVSMKNRAKKAIVQRYTESALAGNAAYVAAAGSSCTSLRTSATGS